MTQPPNHLPESNRPPNVDRPPLLRLDDDDPNITQLHEKPKGLPPAPPIPSAWPPADDDTRPVPVPSFSAQRRINDARRIATLWLCVLILLAMLTGGLLTLSLRPDLIAQLFPNMGGTQTAVALDARATAAALDLMAQQTALALVQNSTQAALDLQMTGVALQQTQRAFDTAATQAAREQVAALTATYNAASIQATYAALSVEGTQAVVNIQGTQAVVNAAATFAALSAAATQTYQAAQPTITPLAPTSPALIGTPPAAIPPTLLDFGPNISPQNWQYTPTQWRVDGTVLLAVEDQALLLARGQYSNVTVEMRFAAGTDFTLRAGTVTAVFDSRDSGQSNALTVLDANNSILAQGLYPADTTYVVVDVRGGRVRVQVDDVQLADVAYASALAGPAGVLAARGLQIYQLGARP
jgi:hypothetical protein